MRDKHSKFHKVV